MANPGEGKVTYVCACSKEAIAKGIKAGDFVKLAAQMSQGNGGGRPDMAQSGGKDASKVDEVFALIRSKL
ncbi:MAG: DHHA1 domain-containing protein [Holdemania massiliensis]